MAAHVHSSFGSISISLYPLPRRRIRTSVHSLVSFVSTSLYPVQPS
jgi:hypothetical protein